MSAHTPGPWKVINHPRVVHVSSQRSVGFGGNGMSSVAWLTGGSLAQEANASLIAAAPDLLAALKAMVEWGPLAESLDVAEFRVDVANARAAIAKAEGQS